MDSCIHYQPRMIPCQPYFGHRGDAWLVSDLGLSMRPGLVGRVTQRVSHAWAESTEDDRPSPGIATRNWKQPHRGVTGVGGAEADPSRCSRREPVRRTAGGSPMDECSTRSRGSDPPPGPPDRWCLGQPFICTMPNIEAPEKDMMMKGESVSALPVSEKTTVHP